MRSPVNPIFEARLRQLSVRFLFVTFVPVGIYLSHLCRWGFLCHSCAAGDSLPAGVPASVRSCDAFHRYRCMSASTTVILYIVHRQPIPSLQFDSTRWPPCAPAGPSRHANDVLCSRGASEARLPHGGTCREFQRRGLCAFPGKAQRGAVAPRRVCVAGLWP